MRNRLAPVFAALLIAAATNCDSSDEPVDFTIDSVAISTNTARIPVGGNLQLSGIARNAGGQIVPVPSATWTSSNPSVATISTSGMVTGVSNGSATITVTIASKTATKLITVE